MDGKRWHPRSKSNTRSDRRYQKLTHRLDGRRHRPENTVPRAPGTRRSSRDSIASDNNREDDIRFNTGGGGTSPRDKSPYSAPPPSDVSSDDDDDDDDADVAAHLPTGTRLRTSGVVDPYLGDSLSSVTPTPYSLSSKNRKNVIRRSSSTATFSEEELNIKYRKVEGAPPSRAVTDSPDVVQTASSNAGTPHRATRKSRSEYSSRRPLPIDDVKRPYSETGTRQRERTHRASKFQDDDDSEMGRISYKSTRATQTEAMLETGLRPPRDRLSHEGRDVGTAEKYSGRVSYERPQQRKSYNGRSSRFLSNANNNSRADRHQTFTVECPSSQGGVHDSPVVSEAASQTRLPRFLRSTCDVPDLVLDGEDERHSALNYESNTGFPSARLAPYGGSTRASDRSPPSPDAYGHVGSGRESTQDAARSNAPGRSSLVQSVQAHELSTGRSLQMNQPKRDRSRSVSTSRTLSPSPESSLKSGEAPMVSKVEAIPQSRASPKRLPPEESSSLTGRTEDLATVTVGESSDVEAATDGPSSGLAVRRTRNKAVQVSIAQPDKLVIICTVLSGALTIALVAVILFGVLSR